MARNSKYRLEKVDGKFAICKRKGILAPFQPMTVTRHGHIAEIEAPLVTNSHYDGMQVIAILKQGLAVFAIFDDIYYINTNGEPVKITGRQPNAK